MRITAVFAALLLGGCVHAGPAAGPATPTRPPEVLVEGVSRGNLDACDDRDEDGRLFDTWAVSLRRGDRVRIWVASGGIDGMLEVTGPGDLRLECDDFLPGSLSPAIELEAPADGRYLARVTTFGPGQTGAYEVGLARVDPAVGRSLSTAADETGMAVTSGAGAGIPMGADYWMELRAGERLRVRVTSPTFDTVAALLSPAGRVWVNDDAGDVGPDGSERPLDSTLLVVAPEAGRYHLVVSSYGGRGGGDFRVRTSARPPVVLAAGEPVPSVGFAGRQGDGRILGLFAGITDYGEGHGDLYGCADDATLLARAFRERGLMDDSRQTVLTDIDANRAAFSAALGRLAAESTAADVVVIFYSGHGGTEPDADPDPGDIDGTDETIVLYDGDMRDDELVSLIDQITADVIILALDSCHSGGFARDFLSRPGRIGLFSSDEDVLSDTAEPLLGGGYLSVALRRAVLGSGDAMPADGALFAGELTDSLHRQFVEHDEHINPEGSTSPMQWLAAARGSVAWSDLLWLYPRAPDGTLVPVPEVALDSEPPRTRGSAEPPPRPTTCP